MSFETPTLFPISVYEDDDTGYAILEARKNEAHDRIIEDHVSPYEAWMLSVGAGLDMLPDYMGLSEAECATLLKNPDKSPPPGNVLRFCLRIGVHPTDLLPVLSNDAYKYHFSILEAMMELVKDKKKFEICKILENRTVPVLDKQICIEAFHQVRKQYERLGVDGVDGNYSLDAVARGLRQLANNAMPANFKIPGKSREYNYVSGYHHSDIESGLDSVEKELRQKWNRANENVEIIDDEQINLVEKIRTDAGIIFGIDDIYAVVLNIVDNVVQAAAKGIAVGENRRKYVYREVCSNLSEDYTEFFAYTGTHFPESLDNVVREIDAFIDAFHDIKKYSAEFKTATDELETFRAWRRNEGVERHDLEIIRSYMLVKPALLNTDKLLSHQAAMNEKRHMAHNLILHQDKSPYEAWMTVSGRDLKELPGIFHVSPSFCDMFLKDPSQSPPPASVIRFCRELNIHPADLQPGSNPKYPDHRYHYSVLVAMTEYLKSKPSADVRGAWGMAPSDEDKQRCLVAFRAENDRYNRMIQGNAIFRVYMQAAFATASQISISNQLADSGVVKYRLGRHPGDISDIVEMHQQFLGDIKARSEIELREAAIRAASSETNLNNFAKIIYGEEDAEVSVKEVIKLLDVIAASGGGDDFWLMNSCQIIGDSYFEGDYWDREMSFPPLGADFEENARKEGITPRDAKMEFLDLLNTHMSNRERFHEISEKADTRAKMLASFTSWVNHDRTQHEHFYQLANFWLVKPYLVSVDREQRKLENPFLQPLAITHQPHHG